MAVYSVIVSGSAMNMGIMMISGSIIPPPEGIDVTTVEGLKESLHLFQPGHFVMPFLVHALGTLTGAILGAWIAASLKITFAFIIGVLFLAGGIANTFMLPSPAWFTVVELVLAYLPVAWLGGKFTLMSAPR